MTTTVRFTGETVDVDPLATFDSRPCAGRNLSEGMALTDDLGCVTWILDHKTKGAGEWLVLDLDTGKHYTHTFHPNHEYQVAVA